MQINSNSQKQFSNSEQNLIDCNSQSLAIQAKKEKNQFLWRMLFKKLSIQWAMI